jgi:hypothetical protein
MIALKEVISGEELGNQLFAFQILKFAIGVGHARTEKGSLETAIAAPLLTIWQDQGSVALTDTFSDHNGTRTRAVNVAALLEQVASYIKCAEEYDCAGAKLHTEYRSIFLV